MTTTVAQRVVLWPLDKVIPRSIPCTITVGIELWELPDYILGNFLCYKYQCNEIHYGVFITHNSQTGNHLKMFISQIDQIPGPPHTVTTVQTIGPPRLWAEYLCIITVCYVAVWTSNCLQNGWEADLYSGCYQRTRLPARVILYIKTSPTCLYHNIKKNIGSDWTFFK